MARLRVHARCGKTSAQGIRCKTLVPVANALRFVRGGALPFYCAQHEKEILAEKAMGTIPFRGKGWSFLLYVRFLPLVSFRFWVFRTAHAGGSPAHDA